MPTRPLLNCIQAENYFESVDLDLGIEENLAIIFTQQLLLRKLIHFRVSKEDFQMFYCS